LVAPRPLRRATTHTDLQLRAVDKGIPVRVVHNASVMNAIGACGLQLYRYGEVRTAAALVPRRARGNHADATQA
jgi:diphthamide biosynthesis methyltransferase